MSRSPPTSSLNHHSIKKVFLPPSCESENINRYLHRGAYVQAFGRPIKTDDVALALACKANCPGPWTTKILS
ncbi:putative isoflavone reductase [Cocos nucifera]|uniref:Putative isoflavone reductase n=1 Tax=Cocos nucifera TaxID=13894 RepID=A0A8K0MXQ1_COCNU|nr:putative isoflavone reductase [Cocos nucifera]